MSLFDFDTEQDDRTAVKRAIALAVSRYTDTIGKFVQNKPERLSIVEEQVGRIASECAESSKADPSEVTRLFRAYLATEVAVTKPEKQNVTDTAEYNNSDEVPQPEHGVRDDVKSGEPVLEPESDGHIDMSKEDSLTKDESKKKTAKQVSCDRCSSANAQEDSILCASCNHFVVAGEGECGCECESCKDGDHCKGDSCHGEAPEKDRSYSKEAVGRPIPCPNCGAQMMPSQNPTNPAMAGNQQTCPSCGTTIQVSPGAMQQAMPQQPMMGQPVQPMAAKQSAPGDLEDPDSPVEEGAQSPAEADPTEQQLPPAVEEDSNGPAEVYTGVVQETANLNAAQDWSTPGDQDIQKIAEQFGIDPDDVRKNLRIVADFGDSLAVNGDSNGDPNMDGLTELPGFGGRIPSQEQEVDVDGAIQNTADKTNLSPDDVYALVKESYGGDIAGKHYVSVQGESHYYLPEELVGQQQQAQPDVDQPSETPQDAYQSSLRSLAAFLDWEKTQIASA